MTTEQIIQRLLDNKHISVSEATQMIRDLVRNEFIVPRTNPAKYPNNTQVNPLFISYNTQVVMYGIIPVDGSDDWWDGTKTWNVTSSTANTIYTKSDDEPEKLE